MRVHMDTVRTSCLWSSFMQVAPERERERERERGRGGGGGGGGDGEVVVRCCYEACDGGRAIVSACSLPTV